MSNQYQASKQPVEDREQRKFQADGNGDVAVNVIFGEGALGSLLQGVKFNYIEAAYPSSVEEIYTYKNGGAGGPIVAVIEVFYTDSTKRLLSTLERTT